MTPGTARALYAKLHRYRAEPGYGWLDAFQVVEETAAELGKKKAAFEKNIPALACFLAVNAPASVAAATPGMTMQDLLHRVRKARNGAVHRGTAGGRLREDVEAVLRLIEEALMAAMKDDTVGARMVRGFMEARPGESPASARDTMLRYDISTLPVRLDEGHGGWRWLTAVALAGHTTRTKGDDMKGRVDTLDLKEARVVDSGMSCKEASGLLASGEPALLVAVDGGEPIGILTAFDLLYAS